MTNNEKDNLARTSLKIFDKDYLVLSSVLLSALILTFIVSNVDFTFRTKAVIFSSHVFIYAGFAVFLYYTAKIYRTPESRVVLFHTPNQFLS